VVLPDVNILIHAFRPDSPDHRRCHAWLAGVIKGDSRFAMSPQVMSSVVRIVTSPRIFTNPDPLADVLTFCEVLLDHPLCVVLHPGEGHWRIFSELCLEADARGKLVPDAWIAALAIANGCEWITMDRDFARFPNLKWRLPD